LNAPSPFLIGIGAMKQLQMTMDLASRSWSSEASKETASPASNAQVTYRREAVWPGWRRNPAGDTPALDL